MHNPVTPQADETPTQRLDRLTHAAIAPLTGGLSPVSLALAMADWWHLGVSPGRQLELAALATRLAKDSILADGKVPDDAGMADDDPRFRHEAWAAWPFSQVRTGFRNMEAFWHEAARVPGMTAHHADMTQFFARQWLGMMAPANWLPTNPVVLKDVMESKGTHLMAGAQNWLSDVTGLKTAQEPAPDDHFKVGRDVAVTPGKVVFRNQLIELIRYDAQTDKVHPEPVLVIPSWIMKYYILDLSPGNSMVRYLVGQGHTVYMVSWRNPDAQDHDLSMDDYLRMGVIESSTRWGNSAAPSMVSMPGLLPGWHATGHAAAALGRKGGMSETSGLPALIALTLLAAQTDFSEPGELGLSLMKVRWVFWTTLPAARVTSRVTRWRGRSSFCIRAIWWWTRRMREYLMGEREQQNDLMAWNADTTRMPARMHHDT